MDKIERPMRSAEHLESILLRILRALSGWLFSSSSHRFEDVVVSEYDAMKQKRHEVNVSK
jgi:hypothetical protein